jgi:anti-sigma factor RsiW
MEQQPPIDEDDLHAYVDGRLDTARREMVSRHLAANPAQHQRVADWAAHAEELRRALRPDDANEQSLMLARLAGLRTARPATPLWRQPWAVAASIVLAMMVGGVGGWAIRGSQSPTEIARLGVEAASAYRIFANDPSRSVEISSDNQAELVAWMTQKLGRRILLPDLAAQGYHLVGGRVLAAMYGPAAMLVYRDAADNRITIYVQPMRIGEPAAMRPFEAQAVDGYAWIAHQVGYTVMSDGHLAQLRSVAAQVQADAHP